MRNQCNLKSDHWNVYRNLVALRKLPSITSTLYYKASKGNVKPLPSGSVVEVILIYRYEREGKDLHLAWWAFTLDYTHPSEPKGFSKRTIGNVYLFHHFSLLPINRLSLLYICVLRLESNQRLSPFLYSIHACLIYERVLLHEIIEYSPCDPLTSWGTEGNYI